MLEPKVWEGPAFCRRGCGSSTRRVGRKDVVPVRSSFDGRRQERTYALGERRFLIFGSRVSRLASRVTVRPELVEGRVLALEAPREPGPLPRSQQQAVVQRAHEIHRRLGVRPVAGVGHGVQAGGGKMMMDQRQCFGIHPRRVFAPDDAE